MPRNSEIKFSDYFKSPNPGLRSYFDIVRRGQPEIYRTPFAKGRDVSEVLQEWMPVVRTLADRWPTLVDFEEDLAKKVGPMSVMKPLEERLIDIDHYYDDITLPSVPIKRSALLATISEWNPVRGLELRAQNKTVQGMKLSTNSGSPFFTKRRLVQGDTLPCYVDGSAAWNSDVYQSLDAGHSTWMAAAVLGWRGQEGGPNPDDVKQRVVWMFPFAVNIAELQFYQPAIEAAQRFNLVPAWVSMEAVDERITRMFDTKGSDDLVVCTDFERFDQHFNDELQFAALEIIRSIMSASVPNQEWLRQVFPIKYKIPLAYDYGKIRYGRHGMGSGSGGTNFDETLVHRSLQYEAAIKAHARLNPNSQCLGDDGIITYPGITVEDVVRSYTSHGLTMNESKQYASKQDCTYLRRWHHQDYRVNGVCVGVYSTARAIGRLCEQERYYDPEIWGARMVALRQLSILENVKWHPLREQFVKFCMRRDKYRLGLDIPNFLDSIELEAKKAMEIMPDFLGYTKSMQLGAGETGISDWWIVKYLKSLA